MLGFLARPPASPRTTTGGPYQLALATSSVGPDVSVDAPDVPAAAPAAPLELALDILGIDSADLFEAISLAASDLVTNGRVVKFLVDRRDPAAPILHFVNGNFCVAGEPPAEARYHWNFARSALGIPEDLDEFNQVTYFTTQKRYIAGVVHTYVLAGRDAPVFGIQAYPQDLISEGLVVEAVRIVRAGISLPGAAFAFVPTGTQQTVATVLADLGQLGVEVLPLDQVFGGLDYLPMNPGDAWGHLRVFPTDLEGLRATDIAVLDELPLDLSVVAGVLTRQIQDASSHVNLKSKERGTPDAVLRSASATHALLQPLLDRPVHMRVGAELVIEPSTEAEVIAKLRERLDGPRLELPVEPESAVRTFDQMASGSLRQTRAFADRYGTKSTNLALLAHRDALGRVADAGSPSAVRAYELVPAGFGVPLQAYRDFVDHPPNSQLRDLLNRLLEAVKGGGLSPHELEVRAAEVRTAFMDAAFPPGALERVRAALDATLPGVTKVKVRSSANAEDVPNFDGAGLHDSFAADPTKADDPAGSCRVEREQDGSEVKQKVKPKSVGCAVKGVYASLWNKRAIEERTFARIDHRTAAMGVCVVGAYDADAEVADNAVIITRVLGTDQVYGYTISLQLGNNLVTNPDPGTAAENTIAAFLGEDEPVSLTITRFATPAHGEPARTSPLLERDAMLDLLRLAIRVEEAYCRADDGYFDGPCGEVTSTPTKPSSLDLEVKVLTDGRLVFKQVRQFGGR